MSFIGVGFGSFGGGGILASSLDYLEGWGLLVVSVQASVQLYKASLAST